MSNFISIKGRSRISSSLSIALAIIISLFCAISCQNSVIPSEATNVNFITYNAKIEFSGAIPQEFISSANSKSAFPNGASNSEYFIILKNLTENMEYDNIQNPDFITLILDNKTFSLQIKANCEYKIIVQMRDRTDNNIIYFSAEDSFSTTTKKTVYTHSFLLQPETSSGFGHVELNLSCDMLYNESTGVYPQLIKVTDINTNQVCTDKFALNSNGTNSTLKDKNSESVPSGSYLVELEVRTSNSSPIYNPRMFYIREVVNVFANLTTNTWYKTTNDCNYISDDHLLSITETMIQQFVSHNLYVNSNSTVEDTPNGTYSKPFTSLAQAFSYISTVNSSGAYTIHIKDGHSETITSEILINQDTTIECYKDMPDDRLGNATLFNGITEQTSYNYMLKISDSSSSTLDLTGITIDQNSDNQPKLSAFFVPPNATLNLTNCTIQNLYVKESNCAAIQINGTVNLKDCTITNNRNELSDLNKGCILCTSSATINLSGKIIIKDNLRTYNTDTYQSNIFLQKNLNIQMNISGKMDSDSDVHFNLVSFSFITVSPSPGEPQPFAIDSSRFAKPSYFTDDSAGHNVIIRDGDNLSLGIGGGQYEPSNFAQIQLCVDKKIIDKSKNDKYAITIYGKYTDNDITNKLTNIEVDIYNRGDFLTTVTGLDVTHKFNFPDNYRADTYELVIRAKYNGITYSDNQFILVKDK